MYLVSAFIYIKLQARKSLICRINTEAAYCPLHFYIFKFLIDSALRDILSVVDNNFSSSTILRPKLKVCHANLSPLRDPLLLSEHDHASSSALKCVDLNSSCHVLWVNKWPVQKTHCNTQQGFSIFIDFLDNFFSSVIHNRSLQWYLHKLSFNTRRI